MQLIAQAPSLLWIFVSTDSDKPILLSTDTHLTSHAHTLNNALNEQVANPWQISSVLNLISTFRHHNSVRTLEQVLQGCSYTALWLAEGEPSHLYQYLF